jgi:superoxide dismutase, Cu-Zn family
MTITRLTTIGALCAAVAIATGVTAPAHATFVAGADLAEATIVDTGGTPIGFAVLTEDGPGRVHVNVKVSGLEPGLHGIHVHGVGSCGANFAAAGGHHNPLAQPHGGHAGDLPNLIVNADGQGRLNATVTGFTLSASATGAFDVDGSSIIVHAAPDDFVTQPTGNSGGRVACGVIVPA